MLTGCFSDDRKDGILEVGVEFSGDEADPDYTEYMTGKKIPLGKAKHFFIRKGTKFITSGTLKVSLSSG
jgi:hypothetical protein